MSVLIKALTVICLLCCIQLGVAAPVVVQEAKQDLAHHIWYLEDKDALLTIDQIQQKSQWQQQQKDKPYFGYSKSAFWLKVSLQTEPANHTLYRLLEIAYPLLDDIHIYLSHDQKVIQEWRLGDRWTFYQNRRKTSRL